MKTNASDWLSCAASCSRRVCASFAAFGQNKSAPALFARSTCSADHQRFFSSAVSTTITRPGSMPCLANAGAYGTCGGAIKAIHSPARTGLAWEWSGREDLVPAA